MKVGRRYAILLASWSRQRSRCSGHGPRRRHTLGAKASKLTIWVDNVQKPAIDKVASAWGTTARRRSSLSFFHSFGNIRDDLKTVKGRERA
jgi:hypothetical protein